MNTIISVHNLPSF